MNETRHYQRLLICTGIQGLALMNNTNYNLYFQAWSRSPEDLQGEPGNGQHPGEDQVNRFRLLPVGGHRPQPGELCLRRNHPHQVGANRMSTQA